MIRSFVLFFIVFQIATTVMAENSSRIGNAPINKKIDSDSTSVRPPKNGETCGDCEKAFYSEGEPENLLNYWDAKIFGSEDTTLTDSVE